MRAIFQWKTSSRVIELGRKTLVMGIVNVTPDSFSDGGLYIDASKAVSLAERLLEEGAAIIDVGGESTRPGAHVATAAGSASAAGGSVSEEEERRRVVPVIHDLKKRFPHAVISVDTYKAIADDPTAAYWNPAGLAQLTQPEVLGMYGSYLNDKDRNLYFSFTTTLKKDIHIGISTNNLFYSDIPGAHADQYTASLAIPLDPQANHHWFGGLNVRYLFADTGSGGGGTVEGVAVT